MPGRQARASQNENLSDQPGRAGSTIRCRDRGYRGKVEPTEPVADRAVAREIRGEDDLTRVDRD